jgi:hypothetical protein
MFTGEELITAEALNQPNSTAFQSGSIHGVRHKVITGYVNKPGNIDNYLPAKVTMVEDNI